MSHLNEYDHFQKFSTPTWYNVALAEDCLSVHSADSQSSTTCSLQGKCTSVGDTTCIQRSPGHGGYEIVSLIKVLWSSEEGVITSCRGA